jgi:hypothetical protein
MNRSIKKTTLFILFVILNAFDCFTTYIILEGGGREVSPFMAYVMGKFSYVGMVAVKMSILTLMFVFLSKLSKTSLYILNVAFVIILLNNLFWVAASMLGYL